MRISSRGDVRQFRWKSVYNDMLARCRRLHHGERLAVLGEICRRYGVSMITARRVAVELAKNGYVENKRRMGMLVRKVPDRLAIKLLLPRYFGRDELLSGRAAIMRLYAGMTARAAQLNVSVVLMDETALPAALTQTGPRPVFLVHQEVEPATLECLVACKLPFISFPYSSGSESFIDHDLKKGAYLATRHLIDLKHRRIAFVPGAITTVWFFPRFKGYIKALRSAGIALDWGLIKETGGLDPQEDKRILRSLLNLKNPPTAIVAGNDERAMHMLDYCREQGIKVPRDLSIVGFDNIDESSMTDPALTTIDTHLDRMGAEAVNMLVSLASGNRIRSLTVSPDLVVRKSTGTINAVYRDKK